MPNWFPFPSFFLPDESIRRARDEEVRERLERAGEYWTDRFEKSDIYLLVSSFPGNVPEKPLLMSSLGSPHDPMIEQEVRDHRGHEFSDPLHVTRNLHRVWMGTRERHKNQMRFVSDRDRDAFGGREVIYAPDELARDGFRGDCDDFAGWDLSMAQRVLGLYADYLGVPEEHVMWAARYVVGQTFSGEGHATLNVADLGQILKKKRIKSEKDLKCRWKNPNSTTLFREARWLGWDGFRDFPDAGYDGFRLNHSVIWGSADSEHCYTRTEEMPHPENVFYRKQNYISFITESERERFGRETTDGMLNLLERHHMNLESMKTAMSKAEDGLASGDYAEINDQAVGSICSYLKEQGAASGLSMLEMIGGRDGVVMTLRLKYDL